MDFETMNVIKQNINAKYNCIGLTVFKLKQVTSLSDREKHNSWFWLWCVWFSLSVYVLHDMPAVLVPNLLSAADVRASSPPPAAQDGLRLLT